MFTTHSTTNSPQIGHQKSTQFRKTPRKNSKRKTLYHPKIFPENIHKPSPHLNAFPADKGTEAARIQSWRETAAPHRESIRPCRRKEFW
jgi:hypothetical protein